MAKWIEISEHSVPTGVRFDVPGRNQGQIVEVAYGGFSRAVHDSCDPYKRVVDKSLPGWPAKYYKRDAQ